MAEPICTDREKAAAWASLVLRIAVSSLFISTSIQKLKPGLDNISGMVEMFEILKKASGRDPSTVEAFFSTHPSPQARIKDLSAVVAAHRTGTRDSREFQVIKSRLLHNRKSG